MNTVAWLDHMLASTPFLLGPRRLHPSSMCPRSMCVHAMAKTRKLVDKQWKENAKSTIKRHKADKHDRHGEHRNKDVSKQVRRQTSKTTRKQLKRKTSKRWCP